MARYHISTPLNSAQLRDIAATLRHFADRYDDLASQVDGLGKTLPVTHWISLQDAMKEINKHVSAAFLAYGAAVMTRSSAETTTGTPIDGKKNGQGIAKAPRAIKGRKAPSRAAGRSRRAAGR